MFNLIKSYFINRKLLRKIKRSPHCSSLLTHSWISDKSTYSRISFPGNCDTLFFDESYKCSICNYIIFCTYTDIIHYPAYRPDSAFTIVGSESCRERTMRRALE